MDLRPPLRRLQRHPAQPTRDRQADRLPLPVRPDHLGDDRRGGLEDDPLHGAAPVGGPATHPWRRLRGGLDRRGDPLAAILADHPADDEAVDPRGAPLSHDRRGRMFDLPRVLTNGGPGTSTETLVLYSYNSLFTSLNFGYGSALAVMSFLIVML